MNAAKIIIVDANNTKEYLLRAYIKEITSYSEIILLQTIEDLKIYLSDKKLNSYAGKILIFFPFHPKHEATSMFLAYCEKYNTKNDQYINCVLVVEKICPQEYMRISKYPFVLEVITKPLSTFVLRRIFSSHLLSFV